MYLYRAVDSDGNTVEFMLSPSRGVVSVKRFFRKALRAKHTVAPRVINVGCNPSYPKAVSKLRKKGTLLQGCKLRPVKYLNNLIEQDHRFIKRRVNPGMGFGSFGTAWRTIQGYGQRTNFAKDRYREQQKATFIARSGSFLEPVMNFDPLITSDSCVESLGCHANEPDSAILSRRISL